MEKLLELRNKMKQKKPKFKRVDRWKFKKLTDSWRKPSGRHNKVRKKIRGYLPHPSYSSPKKVKGMHPSGLFEKLVHNVNDLDNVDPKRYVVRIGRTVGNRKRIEIVNKAKKLKLKVLNPAVKIKEKKEEKKGKKPAADEKANKIGFDSRVVPQVLQRKTKTYRVRDHNFRPGDKVEFKNSKTSKIFGNAVITNVEKTTVKKIDLKDPAHGDTYNNVDELISAFNRHKPEVKVTPDTEVFIYNYKFTPSKKEAKKTKKEKKNDRKDKE